MSLSISHLQNEAGKRGLDKIQPEDSSIVEFLRVAYQLCRTKPKIDFFRACDVLKTSEEASLSAYVEALVRGLPAALQRSIIFHKPGNDELSFDEAWLLRAIQCYASCDEDSLAFLLKSRAKPESYPHLMFLISKISFCLR